MNQDRPHVAKIYPRECRINTDRASDETANHNQDLHDPLCCFSQQAFRKDPADVDMDNAEDAAKRIRLMDARSLPGRPIVPNALIARTEPGSPVSHVPVTRMTIALNVQMIIVHINTSKIPNIPCLTGSFVFAWACRMLALPFPPSFSTHLWNNRF